MQTKIHLVECPRDAMQGWKDFIPTQKKIAYINALLKVGFHTIDFGSFVSPKAIPQMADTREVVSNLQLTNSTSRLLAIVANGRGAEDAAEFEQINCLGFPFSVSPTFQMRNTNSSMEESWKRVEDIQNICVRANKQLVVYISMGFGNPYGDPYNEEIVFAWVQKITGLGIRIISLADTVGLATPEQVKRMTSHLVKALPENEIGVHLHSTPSNWEHKIEAAYEAGCRRFDGAIKGIGGCPMANDELVGNMNTEWMISYFQQKKHLNDLNMPALKNAIDLAETVFV
jgi:hydroxymethylglutaryl-CoA lyase